MYLNDDFSGGDFIFADAHGKMEVNTFVSFVRFCPPNLKFFNCCLGEFCFQLEFFFNSDF